MYTTRRKTGFVGFLVATDSIKSIFFELVDKKEATMNYILTYKFSQDHLELFSGAIRSSGGFNNNPTAKQFTAAYKRLLLRSSIQGRNGNCTKQDETDILEVIGDTYKAKSSTDSNITIKMLLSSGNMTYKGQTKTKMMTMIIVMHLAFPQFPNLKWLPYHSCPDGAKENYLLCLS